MQFEFATASRILFGAGSIQKLPGIAREFGRRALVVTGRDTSRAASLVAALEDASFSCSVFATKGEPTLDTVRNGARAARNDCDLVIGFGGGSAIDAAKAIAALATNSGEPLDYLEIIGKGGSLERAGLPVIAVPTTAGTGAEVTRNAVLGSAEHRVKASLRSPLLLPKVALIDPDLTLELPPSVTATTGLDTLTQLLEAYVSVRANTFTDLFCREGLKRVAASLFRAFRDGHDRNARESMSFASLLSGLALANAGLGVVHGFAAPLGGMLDAPHGGLCAALLPHGVEGNIRALRTRAPGHPALQRFSEIARILTGTVEGRPDDAVSWINDLCREFRIPLLHSYGLERKQIPTLVEKAARANSMKGNPIPLAYQELLLIAERAF